MELIAIVVLSIVQMMTLVVIVTKNQRQNKVREDLLQELVERLVEKIIVPTGESVIVHQRERTPAQKARTRIGREEPLTNQLPTMDEVVYGE